MTHSDQADNIVLSVFLALALLLLLIGWSIKFKKQVTFVAGYDEKRCEDKEGLASYVGGSLLVTGILGAILIIIAFLISTYAKQIIAVYIMSVCIGSAVSAYGAKKYLKSS